MLILDTEEKHKQNGRKTDVLLFLLKNHNTIKKKKTTYYIKLCCHLCFAQGKPNKGLIANTHLRILKF